MLRAAVFTALVFVFTASEVPADPLQAETNNSAAKAVKNQPARPAALKLTPIGHASADTPYSYFSKSCAAAYASGHYAEAEKLCSDAIDDLHKQKITDTRLAMALANLAAVKRQQGQYDISDKLFKSALSYIKAQPATDKNAVKYIIDQYAGLLRRMDRPTQAKFISENPQAVLDSIAPAGKLAGFAAEDRMIFQQTRFQPGIPRPFSSTAQASIPPASPDCIRAIADHDVVIIIDKSGSMDIRDCPDGLSRWQWCAEQMRALTRDTACCFPQGITVVLFSDEYIVYKNTTIDRVAEIFDINFPSGGTNTELALENQLNDYFSNRSLLNEKQKPLLVAVITDGEPNHPHLVRDTILNAERRMSFPSEISITFLQVGSDIWGTIQLAALHNSLTGQRPGFDIAHVITFDELEQTGLLPALSRAVTQQSSQPLGPLK